ncbi:MAG TPA: Mur ligase family protein [Chloroflexia bacterium]|nr:Mur ligase family protein [Chloroflexia bacterium]
MDELEATYRYLDGKFKAALGLPYPNDLTRVYRLLDRLGNPNGAFPAVIVTGSKGKGSTASFLAALLQAGGLKVGLFTGPHLHTYRERFKINGADITPEKFVELFNTVRQAVEDSSDGTFISRFEIITAMAMLYFAQEKVDLAVLEVGLGGRFDAVNVSLNSPLAVITPIEMEHVHSLGPTIADIVHHKAGVMRPHGQAVSSHQSPQVEQLLRNEASEMKVHLRFAAELWQYRKDSLALRYVDGRLWQEFEACGPDGQWQRLRSGLSGTFQVENALTALAAVESLAEMGLTSKPRLNALLDATIPGRLEVAGNDPLILLDGAHTPNAMHELTSTLSLFKGTPVWVLGFLRDKKIGDMLEVMPLEGQVVFVTEIDSHRKAPYEMVLENMKQHPARLESELTVPEAIAKAREAARAVQGGYVCVTGSLYLAAEARNALGLLDRATAEEAELISRIEHS